MTTTNNNNNLDAKLFGMDLFGDAVKQTPKSITAQRFGVPPFSVLNTREGNWQDRKRAWIRLGIQSEIGRAKGTIAYATEGYDYITGRGASDASVFDPVLCELMYRWFCPANGQVVDPFAGGSVRGIVAAVLGLKYWGCDLRQQQIDANLAQGKAILPINVPTWICGDSTVMLSQAPTADFIFSCPPYGDLEQYSEDPRDLSTMNYPAFLLAYKRIIDQCYIHLNLHAFAAWVVGDYRDSKGYYQGFVGDTVDAFKQCGFQFYNEAILVNCAGSAPIRVTAQFGAGRKFCKLHQNILIFYKGDWHKAVANLPAFDMYR